MKKILVLLLAAVLLISFAACGGQKELRTDVLTGLSQDARASSLGGGWSSPF